MKQYRIISGLYKGNIAWKKYEIDETKSFFFIPNLEIWAVFGEKEVKQTTKQTRKG